MKLSKQNKLVVMIRLIQNDNFPYRTLNDN